MQVFPSSYVTGLHPYVGSECYPKIRNIIVLIIVMFLHMSKIYMWFLCILKPVMSCLLEEWLYEEQVI